MNDKRLDLIREDAAHGYQFDPPSSAADDVLTCLGVIDRLRPIIANLIEDDPYKYVPDRYDDSNGGTWRCFFCRAEEMSPHAEECAWVVAKALFT